MERTEKGGVSEMILVWGLWPQPAGLTELRQALPWGCGPCGPESGRKGRWMQTVLAPSQGWCSQLASLCIYIRQGDSTCISYVLVLANTYIMFILVPNTHLSAVSMCSSRAYCVKFLHAYSNPLRQVLIVPPS